MKPFSGESGDNEDDSLSFENSDKYWYMEGVIYEEKRKEMP